MAGDWFATTGFASTEFVWVHGQRVGQDVPLIVQVHLDNNAYWLNFYSMAGAAGVDGQSSHAPGLAEKTKLTFGSLLQLYEH
ncbi:hypothetical protein pipiens_008391 [Culex pipiens pipiens]|uniref:Uncharacterized protein n=1 Tax=Culex pipiens pipiens TaxID=38569 RepID=A0ABD1CF49_CULPP